MRVVVFGLAVSSSWGNGHATLWRALIRGLAERGHEVTFFERDVPFYAAHRDLPRLPWGRLVLYDEWDASLVRQALDRADAAIVTSYCPDACHATSLLGETACLRVFYDLDTPVTFARLDAGEEVDYLPQDGLQAYELVLSYTGGAALRALRERLGAPRVAPLYGSVDCDAYRPGHARTEWQSVLSHLGTYSRDREARLRELFLSVTRELQASRLVLGGSLYPQGFVDAPHVVNVPHVPPADHPDFYASSQWTLNVTRGAMAAMGYCPSGRLFEAAACEAAILSDTWAGLDTFFTPGEELVVVRSRADVIEALGMPDTDRKRIAEAARARVLAEHTARHRAAELEQLLRGARDSVHTAATPLSSTPRWDAGREEAAS